MGKRVPNGASQQALHGEIKPATKQKNPAKAGFSNYIMHLIICSPGVRKALLPALRRAGSYLQFYRWDLLKN
jgi:hypothetical protein